MIRKRDDIHQWFFVRVDSPDDLDRFADQFPPAIDFHFGFRRFLDSSNLSLKRICSRQRTEVSLYGVDGNTVVIIPNLPDSDLKFSISPAFYSVIARRRSSRRSNLTYDRDQRIL
jgi:hypothetical protein